MAKNLVPAIQHDSLVVAMTNTAAYIHFRVASHCSPIPATPFAIRKSPILLVRQAVLCAGADINRLPTKAIKLLADVGSSSSTRYRFVAQNEKLLHLGIRRWYKKPLPLSNARCVAAAGAVLRPKSAHAALDATGLASLLIISDAGHRRRFLNPVNKTVVLITRTQETGLLRTPATH